MSGNGAFQGQGMPAVNSLETVTTEQYFMALENMTRVFAIRPDDTLLFLSDPLIDPRVFHAIALLIGGRRQDPLPEVGVGGEGGVVGR